MPAFSVPPITSCPRCECQHVQFEAALLQACLKGTSPRNMLLKVLKDVQPQACIQTPEQCSRFDAASARAAFDCDAYSYSEHYANGRQHWVWKLWRLFQPCIQTGNDCKKWSVVHSVEEFVSTKRPLFPICKVSIEGIAANRPPLQEPAESTDRIGSPFLMRETSLANVYVSLHPRGVCVCVCVFVCVQYSTPRHCPYNRE